jgi:hypothetical protein
MIADISKYMIAAIMAVEIAATRPGLDNSYPGAIDNS